jgi:hypothetical protein
MMQVPSNRSPDLPIVQADIAVLTTVGHWRRECKYTVSVFAEFLDLVRKRVSRWGEDGDGIAVCRNRSH